MLAVVGVVSGTLNVLAGGGSFLTLPILIFLGLPPSVANGTNRVGILLQNLSAVASFHHYGVLDRRALAWAALPASLGAIFGTWVALSIGDRAFQKALAFVMVGVTLWSLWPGSRKGLRSPRSKTSLRLPWLGVGFFAVGLYGGFIQAGVGFLVLAVTTAAGLDLVRGNAVKVFAIFCLTAIALALFAWQGQVRWAFGLALAVGTIAGGLLGARLTVLKGHAWVRWVVTTAVLVFAIKLWLDV